MVNVKDIRVDRIDSKSALSFVKRHHYSGKAPANSQLHFGAFYAGRLHGVLSFGPPLDRSKVIGLVEGTVWNDMVELNRMAFDEFLPRNSESRVIAVCLRLLKKHCPHVRWVLSFSDGTQCGDGTIYRASGFLLTAIKVNDQIIEFPDGLRETRLTLTDTRRPRRNEVAKLYGISLGGESSLKPFLAIGAKAVPGFQLRYIYLLDKTARLTVPVLPYSRIDEMGAGMYKGQNVPVSQRKPTPAPEAQMDERLSSTQEGGGSIPTPALTYSLP